VDTMFHGGVVQASSKDFFKGRMCRNTRDAK